MSPFLQLDYLYTPSQDVAADARVFTEVLGRLCLRSRAWARVSR